MTATPSLLNEIKKAKSRVFRRAFIKRRDAVSGLFEASWQEITQDVKKWGKVSKSVDAIRYARFRFSDLNLQVANDEGKFNPSEDEASIWFGYANQQRTLVKVEAGFVHQTLGANGIWTNTEYPTVPAIFMGVIVGDMPVSDNNQVTLPVKPLLDLFRNYPARNLVGWTSTGMNASQFLTMLRDQTDGGGDFIFRPFFGDTTTFWEFTSTGRVFTGLNTATADRVFNNNVWDLLQEIAEVEERTMYIKGDGTFRFVPRDPNTASGSQFHFVGRGFFDTRHGQTIKKVSKFGKKYSDYYSRVEYRWLAGDSATSVRVLEASLSVDGGNAAWNFGTRTLKLENYWFQTSSSVDLALASVFSQVSALKDQIEFETSFVPHLEPLDRVTISYDAADRSDASRWDLADWAFDDTNLASDLIWDNSRGDSIRLVEDEFKLTQVDVDLDNFACKFVAIRI